MNDCTALLNIINGFAEKRILVIGDLLLDVYLKGKSTRLCPEAPVPVVDIDDRTVFPGGAANTVCNLKSLGAAVSFCTAVGDDSDADEVIRLMEGMNIDTGGIIRCRGRKTITKTRVVSGSQVIARIDQGSEDFVDADTTGALIKHIKKAYQDCDAVVISDYDKGVISPLLIDELAAMVEKDRKFIAVDSKRLSFFTPLRPSYAKPNYHEAIRLLDVSAENDRAQQILKYAEQLYHKTMAGILTVTLDQEGSVIVENGRATMAHPASTVSSPHVAGAGDSYISGFVLTYLNCSDPLTSAKIATAAATIAIQKEYTATCLQSELRSHFHINRKLVSDLQDLKDICDEYHRQRKKIVFTNGCFDILHSGHVRYLQQARDLGDVLIVGLNNDESIKRIKGSNRPINGVTDRLEVLSGLTAVNHIIPFGSEGDDTPIPLISIVQPHIFAKGGDYTKERLPEAETVEKFGGEIAFIDHMPDHSTTHIISRIRQRSWTRDKAVTDRRS